MVKLTINDRPVVVPEGTTVLEAARHLGVSIPTLCHFEGLKPYGGCRLCLVEVSARTRTQLTASCTYPVSDGLLVQTGTDEVQEARRFVMGPRQGAAGQAELQFLGQWQPFAGRLRAA